MGFDTECILNIQSLPGEYFCPVCRTLVYPNEALQSQCTHLYCKPCLAYIVATTHACPYDGYLVTEADSKPLGESNNALAEAIGKISVYCLYNRSGCQWQGTFSECITHSTGCTFGNSVVVCNRCGTQIIHRQVHEHAHSCPGVQPQAQQLESGQTQTGTSTAQFVAQDQSAATSLMPASTSLAASAAAASSAVTASMPGMTTAAVPVVASSIATAATPASSATATITTAASLGQSQVNATAYPQPGNVPTPEQWYQQQQLQYQQYYQQYPGYNPYQQYQQYAQQQAYPQYAQSQMQVMPQSSIQGQPVLQPQSQASQYLQPHLHVQSQPSTQFQPQPQALPQPQSQSHPQLQPQPQSQGQNQLHLQPQPQSQIAQLRPPQQPLPQASLQSHPIAQGIQIQQPQRPQVPAHQAHPQAPPQAHLASGQQPMQPLNQTHYPQPQLQPHVQGHQQPQAAAHQVPLQSQPNAQVHPQHQQPHLLPQPHAYPSAVPQHLTQQSHMHPNPQVIPQATAVTGHQSYPQPPAIQQIPPGAPPQRPMFVHSQPQGTPFQHPQQPSQMQNQFPPQQPQQHPPHGHTPTQVQQQSINPAQASLAGYPHQRPPYLVQQLHQHPGMHSHAPQQSVPSQAHPLKPGQTHSQGIANMQNVPVQPQLQQSVPQVQGYPDNQNHVAGGRPPMLSHAMPQQLLLQSTSQFPQSGGHGSLTAEEADVISKESDGREKNNSDQLRNESSASDDLKIKNLKYENDEQTIGEIKVSDPGLPAGTVEAANEQNEPGFSDDRTASLPALKEGTGHEEIRGIQGEVGKSTVIQSEEESNKGMKGEFGTQPVHQDNPSKERVPSQQGYDKDRSQVNQHGPNSEASQNVRPTVLFPGQERYPQQTFYGQPSNFHTTQRFPTPQPGMVQERRLQELPPYQMQTQVHAMTPAQMRASGPNLIEQFPLQGQSTIIPDPFKPPRGQHPHNSHPFDAPHGGIPGAAHFSAGPPGHLGLPPKHLSEYGTAHVHVQGHMSMQHAARPIDGPPGPLDRSNLKPRGPPFGPDGQIGASHSNDSRRSFLFDGKSDDLHGAESKVNGAGKGLGGSFRDPAPAHGLADDKFKPFPEERFGHLSDDGLPQDGNMRPFLQNLGRHASSQRDFEEDMKQLPRAAIIDGGGMPRFGPMPEQLGPDGLMRPFNGVLPGPDRLSNFPRPGDPFAPGSTSEYHLMDSMKRQRPGPLLEDGHHFMDVLPPLRNPGNVHGRNAFGPQNSPRGFLEEPLGQNRHGFGSGYPFPDYSQEPGPFGLKRKPGKSCWCLICKIDCETIEGLEMHSQTREHQKTTMDIVLSIKKENAKKPRASAAATVREEGSKSRKPAYGNQGVRK